MAGHGPAPKPADQRRRRNAPMANTKKIPAAGRLDPAPLWPLDSDIPSVWAELWATPQAVAWDELGWTRVVARYAMALTAAESSMSAPLLSEVRQLEDRLGLTPMAMLRLRWEVSDDVPDERKSAGSAPVKVRRLKVVDPDAVDSRGA